MNNIITIPANTKVHYIDFPTDQVFGCVCQFETDKYDIFINTLCSEEKQLEALRHELAHIKLRHHDRIDSGEITLDEAESEAHAFVTYEEKAGKESKTET